MSKIKGKLEFFFDCSSPWTYLAFREIESLCQRQDCNLIWKPILVGGVFNLKNPSVYESRVNPVKEKSVYSQKDMNDWAKIRGIQFNWPDIFPINSVKAMRGSFFALEKSVLPEYAEIIFSSYWTEGLDISSNETLINIAESLGWDSNEFLAYIEESETKEMLKQNTSELMDRGGFGSPTIFINDSDMYFGNDRLHLIETILAT